MTSGCPDLLHINVSSRNSCMTLGCLFHRVNTIVPVNFFLSIIWGCFVLHRFYGWHDQRQKKCKIGSRKKAEIPARHLLVIFKECTLPALYSICPMSNFVPSSFVPRKQYLTFLYLFIVEFASSLR